MSEYINAVFERRLVCCSTGRSFFVPRLPPETALPGHGFPEIRCFFPASRPGFRTGTGDPSTAAPVPGVRTGTGDPSTAAPLPGTRTGSGDPSTAALVPGTRTGSGDPSTVALIPGTHEKTPAQRPFHGLYRCLLIQGAPFPGTQAVRSGRPAHFLILL